MPRLRKAIERFPPPAGKLDASFIDWSKGKLVNRVYVERWGPVGFNPSDAGNARFSPIRDSAGNIIPTIYAGTTLDCALMETAFHDVPFASGYKPLPIKNLEDLMQTRLMIGRDLHLIDLSAIPLRRLGIERKNLIDTTAAHYPETRQWAEALYQQNPDADGLRWVSRQDDGADAIVLFGTRVLQADLVPQGTPGPLLAGGVASANVLALANRIGVTLID